LHRFAAALIFIGMRVRGGQGGQGNGFPINYGIETVGEANRFIEGLRILEFELHACFGFQSTKEFIEEMLGFHGG
jgi:hypothetical protein